MLMKMIIYLCTNYNPLNVYIRDDRKTETLLNWRFEKISTGMDLIAYKGTKKVSLLTKIANGDTLWNNMGNNYTNIRHIYIETYNNIDYYAILLESDINTRILALRDIYTPESEQIQLLVILFQKIM